MSEPVTGRIAKPAKPPATRYRIARSAAQIYVAVQGLANMKSAPLLATFLDRARSEGVRSAYIDLSGCAGMDSTFMGLLVAQAQSFAEAGGRFVVVKPNDASLKLLRMLGVDEVVTVVAEAEVPTAEYVDLSGDQAVDERARMALVREAHVHLANLNDTNKAKFGAFLQALDADLERKKS